MQGFNTRNILGPLDPNVRAVMRYTEVMDYLKYFTVKHY